MVYNCGSSLPLILSFRSRYNELVPVFEKVVTNCINNDMHHACGQNHFYLSLHESLLLQFDS